MFVIRNVLHKNVPLIRNITVSFQITNSVMLNGRDLNSNKKTVKMTRVTKLLSNKQSWVKSVMLTRCLTQTMANSGQTNILLKKLSQ